MRLRVLHVATHGHNIGDGALVAGLHRVLSEDLEVELDITPLDVLERKLRRENVMLTLEDVQQFNKTVDLVIIGGGGMIEGGRENFASGLNFNFEIELLKSFRIPVVFYALGTNQFRHSHFFHRNKLRQLIDEARRLDMPFSVRNDGSRVRLEQLVGPIPSVDTIPDPGIYVSTSRCQVPEIIPGKRNLLLQLAGDRLRNRFGSGLIPIRLNRCLKQLAKVLASQLESNDLNLVLCPHLMTDVPLFGQFVKCLPKRLMRSSCTMSPVLRGVEGAPDFFERYRQADLVIGMRGHSSICAVGLGTPFIGLGTHDKVLGFLREIGLNHWGIDLEENSIAQLSSLIRQVIDSPGDAREEFQAVLPKMRAVTTAFHRRIQQRLERCR